MWVNIAALSTAMACLEVSISLLVNYGKYFLPLFHDVPRDFEKGGLIQICYGQPIFTATDG